MRSSADSQSELQTPPTRPLTGFGCTFLFAVLLLAITAAAHVWSLWDGTVLDDYWHQKGLREHGWAFSELLRTLEIEPARFLHLWWQNETVRWEYARPLFILCMKFLYVVVGRNDPMPLHAFSILLHAATVLMVWRLALRLTGDQVWSVAGGILMAIYPHALITVAWPSSQNVVLQTTLTLAALMCFISATRIGAERSPLPSRDQRSVGPPCPTKLAKQRPQPSRDHQGAGSAFASFLHSAFSILHSRPRLAMFAAISLWILALFARENALVLPAIFLALDVSAAGWRRAWERRRVYAFMAVIGIVFVAWRMSVVTHGMPDVYIRRPDGEPLEYVLWCAAKLLHYLVASIWIAPMTIGPTGRFNPWTEAPGDCAFMLAILLLVGTIYVAATRRMPSWWVWPLWILLAVLPVIPVVATPHSGYMSGVGFAIGAAVAASNARGRFRHAPRGLVIFFIITMSFGTMFNRWQWTGIAAAEKMLPEWVMHSPPPREARDVFFINMPFVNIYAKPNLVACLGPGFEDVRVHALTFTPQPILLEREITFVEQLDAHSFTVEIHGGAYFSRLLGRFLIEGFSDRGRFHPGQRLHTQHCDVLIIDADDEGVRRLQFTFPKPLSDPSYCFFVATPDVLAARLRFLPADQLLCDPPPAVGAAPTLDEIAMAEMRLGAGDATAAETLFAGIRLGNEEIRAAAAAAFSGVGGGILEALASPAQSELLSEKLDPASWQSIERWWRLLVSDQTLAEVWRPRREFDVLVELREEVPHSRVWAGLVIQTDLYLTGPPFSGPRE